MSSSCLYSTHFIKTFSNFLGIILILFTACGKGPDPLPLPCIEAKIDTGENPHPGNFDYMSCNNEVCHADWIGGWVYNNSQADDIVQGATVTIRNHDGTIVEAVTRSDGFFVLVSDQSMGIRLVPPFAPCVSKCPSIVCAKTIHHSTDCQSSECHGRVDAHLHVSLEETVDNLPCENLPPSGPRVHDGNTVYDQPCQFCHDPSYVGGYVFDGLESTTTVDRAMITLTPTNGTPISVVSGPGGMFQFTTGIAAPYIACISKCDVTICSLPESHPTVENCGDCHDWTNRIHVP